MYIEVDGDLVCINNSDIICKKENDGKHYQIIRYIHNETEIRTSIARCDTEKNVKIIMDIIKKGIENEQNIIKIPTKEGLERWSE